jgi:uncharacterized protein (TIGR00369 family)
MSALMRRNAHKPCSADACPLQEYPMQAKQAQQALEKTQAAWVREMGMEVLCISPGEVTLRLPFNPRLTQFAGVLCGQAQMAAADTAMVLALASSVGEFVPMTTVSMNTSFLRPVGAGDCKVVARVLRRGKKLVFGEIEVLDAQDRLVAHATTTYALL